MRVKTPGNDRPFNSQAVGLAAFSCLIPAIELGARMLLKTLRCFLPESSLSEEQERQLRDDARSFQVRSVG